MTEINWITVISWEILFFNKNKIKNENSLKSLAHTHKHTPKENSQQKFYSGNNVFQLLK